MPRKTPTGPTHRQQRQAQENAVTAATVFHHHRAPRNFERVMPRFGEGDSDVVTSDHDEPRYPNYSHAESLYEARKLG